MITLKTTLQNCRFILLAIFLAAMIVSVPVSGVNGAEYLSDEMACIKLSGRFMGDLVEGEIERAFSQIEPYFPISRRQFEGLMKKTKVQLQGSQSDFGNTLGYKFVREERVKDFLVRFTFVLKHEFTVTKWRFIYYKPSEKWLLNSLNWNDQVEGLFQ